MKNPPLQKVEFKTLIMNSILPLSITLLVLAACTKNTNEVPPKPTAYHNFTGHSWGYYDHQYVDSAGQLKREVWDSTYADTIHVVINYQENTISFTFSSNNYKVQPNLSFYNYALDESLNEYFSFGKQGIRQTFKLKNGDSLYSVYSNIQYGGTTYLTESIRFTGKRTD